MHPMPAAGNGGSKWVKVGWSLIPHGPQGCSRGGTGPCAHTRARLVPNPPQSPGMLPRGDGSTHTQSQAGPKSLCGP